MLLFLDTEFTGLDQTKPDLISIGLVDEIGREFYAELPESNWTVQCNEWVHFNVVPHLWRGDHVDSEAAIRDRIKSWIEDIEGEAVIVSDCPDADFLVHLTGLLTEWPNNLRTCPIQFSNWSMGDELQPVFQKIIDDYHDGKRPKHHALYDAHSLRLCVMHALRSGWKPDS